MSEIITFPEPEWKCLKDWDLLQLHKFVDKTAWELVKSYWGITVLSFGRYGRLECERTPMYPHYNRKETKEYIKSQLGT